MRRPYLCRIAFRPAHVAASLAACVLTAALWARSEVTMDQVHVSTPVRSLTLVSSSGQLFLETVTLTQPGFARGVALGHALPSQYGPRAVDWQFAGLGAGRETEDSSEGPVLYHTYMLPLWIVLVFTSVLPVLSWDSLFPRPTSPAPSDALAEAR